MVIHGPNEAGKSTMMRAIDSLLFGIHSRTTDHFGVGRPSLRIEARLTSASGHSVDVVRTGSTKNPLVDLDGNPVPEDLMSQMLGGIDRKLFQTVFRLDHPQLVGGTSELGRRAWPPVVRRDVGVGFAGRSATSLGSTVRRAV